MESIDIYRAGSLFATVKPDDSSIQSKVVMGENVINLTFRTSSYIRFDINDYCTVFGEVYKMNALPVVNKTGSNLYAYTVTMQSEAADLAKAQYLFLGADNTLKESDFALMGNAATFVNLLLQNILRIDTGWTIGQVINTKYKNLTFSKENCYNALSRIATEFETEFWIEGKTIHLTKRSKDTGFTFRVGANRGLYELKRYNVDNSNVVTRLYAYGGDKNLPAGYAGLRLHLAADYNPCLISNLTYTVTDLGDGTQDIVFTWEAPENPLVVALTISLELIGGTGLINSTGSPAGPVTINVPVGAYAATFTSIGGGCDVHSVSTVIEATITDSVFVPVPLPYIEQNTALYGIIEHTLIFDDIYPHRTGKVTSIDASNPFKIIDAALDFNINDYLLPGLTPKVTFNTGQLAGYSFEISNYIHGNKEITILQNRNETAMEVPSLLLHAAIGDEYVLTDLYMPPSYVEAAEKELLAKAREALENLSFPQVTIQAVLDPKYMKIYGRSIGVGDLVWVVDAPLQVNRKIRVNTCTRNIVNEHSYEVGLTDIVTPGKLDRLVLGVDATARDVTSLAGTVSTSDIFNGRLVLPETAGGAGFQEVLIEVATNKLFRKI